MPRINKNQEPPAPPAPVTEDRETLKLDEYSPEEVDNYIRAKYNYVEPDSYGFTQITLKRFNPDPDIGWENIKKYTSLPEWDAIQREFGGGKYKLWLQYKPMNATWAERKMTVVDLTIAGPSKPIQLEESTAVNTPAAAAPVVDEDPEMKFLLKLAKYREVLGMGGAGSSSGPGDSVLSAAIKANSDLMAKVMEIQKPVESPLVTEFMKQAIQSGLNKSNDNPIKAYLEVANLLDKRGGGAQPETSFVDEINKWLPVIKEAGPILAAMTGRGAPGGGPMGPNPVLNPSQSSVNNPGALPAPGGGIEAGLNQLAQIMDTNFKAISMDLAETKKRLAELEGEEVIESPETTAENLKELTPEQEEEQNVNWGKIIAALPDEQKIATLKDYLSKNTVEEVFKWCITYKAVPDVTEFNRILQLAGIEQYVPTEEVLKLLGLIPPGDAASNNAP